MSSMRPLRYFVVTLVLSVCEAILQEKSTYSIVFLIEVVNVSVQYLHEQLH